MEKLAENDLTYFYLRHVVIVVTAVTTISLTPVIIVAYVWNAYDSVKNIRHLCQRPLDFEAVGFSLLMHISKSDTG